MVEFPEFEARLIQTFVQTGKPAPTHKQAINAAVSLPPEAHLPYLDHLAAKIARIEHPGVLSTDVAAFAAGWPTARQALLLRHVETEAARLLRQQHEQTEAAELERQIREEILPDRYADPAEIARIQKDVPGLGDYKPPPAHIRAVDVRHVRHALYEISRANCPEEIKQEQRQRLTELAQIWPGIVEEVQESLRNAECRAP